jgi:hypothetical protein
MRQFCSFHATRGYAYVSFREILYSGPTSSRKMAKHQRTQKRESAMYPLPIAICLALLTSAAHANSTEEKHIQLLYDWAAHRPDLVIAIVATAMTVLLFERAFLAAIHNYKNAKQSVRMRQHYECKLLKLCARNKAEMRHLVERQLKKKPGIDRYDATRLAYIIALLAAKDDDGPPNPPGNASISFDLEPLSTPEEIDAWRQMIEESRLNPGRYRRRME